MAITNPAWATKLVKEKAFVLEAVQMMPSSAKATATGKHASGTVITTGFVRAKWTVMSRTGWMQNSSKSNAEKLLLLDL